MGSPEEVSLPVEVVPLWAHLEVGSPLEVEVRGSPMGSEPGGTESTSSETGTRGWKRNCTEKRVMVLIR